MGINILEDVSSREEFYEKHPGIRTSGISRIFKDPNHPYFDLPDGIIADEARLEPHPEYDIHEATVVLCSKKNTVITCVTTAGMVPAYNECSGTGERFEIGDTVYFKRYGYEASERPLAVARMRWAPGHVCEEDVRRLYNISSQSDLPHVVRYYRVMTLVVRKPQDGVHCLDNTRQGVVIRTSINGKMLEILDRYVRSREKPYYYAYNKCDNTGKTFKIGETICFQILKDEEINKLATDMQERVEAWWQRNKDHVFR